MAEGSANDRDPRQQTRQVRQRLQDVVRHVREDVRTVEDSRARSLFETTAEVLEGLDRAYEHYERQVGEKPRR